MGNCVQSRLRSARGFRVHAADWLCALALLSRVLLAQSTQPAAVTAEWRRVGTLTLAAGLPSPTAAGAVERVAFSESGDVVATLATGKSWASADGASWREVPAPAPQATAAVERLPESGAIVRESLNGARRLYAAAANLWRSDDAGRTWANLTGTRAGSLLGARALDVAIDTADPTASPSHPPQDSGSPWTEVSPGRAGTRICPPSALPVSSPRRAAAAAFRSPLRAAPWNGRPASVWAGSPSNAPTKNCF